MASIEEVRNQDLHAHIKTDRSTWIEGHYKRVQTNLDKRKKPIYFGSTKANPKSVGEIVWRLIFEREATFCDNVAHCRKGAIRSAQDLYHLIKFYLKIKLNYKECSELLQNMTKGSNALLNFSYCNTVNREVYKTQSLTIKEQRVIEYVNNHLKK